MLAPFVEPLQRWYVPRRQRLSRLFLTQLALNAGFGVVIGAGLWLIGVPSAALWGMVAMILRFVPYGEVPTVI